MPSPIVILVGPPGSGKTTVAGELAALLGAEVRDTDLDIETDQGQPIAEIFVDHGEAYFRELEVAAIRTALTEHTGVLALGGGAVLDERTRAALHGHPVVFLDVGLNAATKRVGMNTARPLLLGNVRSQMKALMEQRRSLYREVAAYTVGTDELTPAEVAADIAGWLEERER